MPNLETCVFVVGGRACAGFDFRLVLADNPRNHPLCLKHIIRVKRHTHTLTHSVATQFIMDERTLPLNIERNVCQREEEEGEGEEKTLVCVT